VESFYEKKEFYMDENYRYLNITKNGKVVLMDSIAGAIWCGQPNLVRVGTKNQKINFDILTEIGWELLNEQKTMHEEDLIPEREGQKICPLVSGLCLEKDCTFWVVVRTHLECPEGVLGGIKVKHYGCGLIKH
jgi:hypothetical protein